MSNLRASIFFGPRTPIEIVDRPYEGGRVVLLKIDALDVGFHSFPDGDQSIVDAIDNLRGHLAILRDAALERMDGEARAETVAGVEVPA